MYNCIPIPIDGARKNPTIIFPLTFTTKNLRPAASLSKSALGRQPARKDGMGNNWERYYVNRG